MVTVVMFTAIMSLILTDMASC